MSINQYENNSFLVLEKYSPEYVIPFSYFENNEIEFENVLFMFYSVVSNEKNNYNRELYYYSLSYETSLTSQDILDKDLCGFSPNEVVIFKTSKEKAEKLISIIKSTPLFKNSYSECL
jgi:hypothetical protein